MAHKADIVAADDWLDDDIREALEKAIWLDLNEDWEYEVGIQSLIVDVTHISKDCPLEEPIEARVQWPRPSATGLDLVSLAICTADTPVEEDGKLFAAYEIEDGGVDQV